MKKFTNLETSFYTTKNSKTNVQVYCNSYYSNRCIAMFKEGTALLHSIVPIENSHFALIHTNFQAQQKFYTLLNLWLLNIVLSYNISLLDNLKKKK